MKKIVTPFLIVMALGALNMLTAQEYKLSVTGNKTLKIHEVGEIKITGYEGSELIFSREVQKDKDSERAEGLKALSAMGLVDNTGIGLSVIESGDVIDVNPMSKRSGPEYEIKVPKNIKVFYEHSTPYGDKVIIKNISSELEVSTNHSSLWLENVTGPMAINTVHGDIEAIFSELNQKSPTSIISVHGLIDITLPQGTKANISLGTEWGEIFTDMDIAVDKGSDLNSSTTQIKGKLNGGGVPLEIATSHSNIYLRKKK